MLLFISTFIWIHFDNARKKTHNERILRILIHIQNTADK